MPAIKERVPVFQGNFSHPSGCEGKLHGGVQQFIGDGRENPDDRGKTELSGLR